MYLHLEKEIHRLHKCTCPLVGNLLKTKGKTTAFNVFVPRSDRDSPYSFSCISTTSLGRFGFQSIFFSRGDQVLHFHNLHAGISLKKVGELVNKRKRYVPVNPKEQVLVTGASTKFIIYVSVKFINYQLLFFWLSTYRTLLCRRELFCC